MGKNLTCRDQRGTRGLDPRHVRWGRGLHPRPVHPALPRGGRQWMQPPRHGRQKQQGEMPSLSAERQISSARQGRCQSTCWRQVCWKTFWRQARQNKTKQNKQKNDSKTNASSTCTASCCKSYATRTLTNVCMHSVSAYTTPLFQAFKLCIKYRHTSTLQSVSSPQPQHRAIHSKQQQHTS